MTESLVIEDPQIAQEIQQIARQEHRSVEEVLSSMLATYQPQRSVDPLPDSDDLARYVYLAAYEKARAYWKKTGNVERAAMTDEQLDEQFSLFDADGIPRLKSEKDSVVLPESSAYRAGQVLSSAGYRSGYTDISMRSREILENEFTDYLLSGKKDAANDADTPSAG